MLQLWNKLYLIDYPIEISIYVKLYIRVHFCLRDSQNIITNTYTDQ